ncbi:hypothetical protein OG788_07930 [Streptomyces sp. NBC_00647]|uniref:hypothetical protein n=1 Tax=Streptomyces sp. NBC_00647 TaxID=2975796 RepID=UPI00324E8D41
MLGAQGAVLAFEGGMGLLQLPVSRRQFLVPAAQFGVSPRGSGPGRAPSSKPT